MPAETPKRMLYAELTRIAKALSAPSRLELIEHLAQGERAVESLANAAGLSLANASHHLHVLREARLVEARKEGLRVFYRLAGPDVFDLLVMLRRVGERRLAEVDRLIQVYITARDSLTALSRGELLRRIEDRTAIVIDVRPSDEFQAGHIAGALSAPLETLRRQLARIPRGKEIIAYCRGPYCLMSSEAVRLLRAKGRSARRLEDGFPEWRAAGLPTAPEPAAARRSSATRPIAKPAGGRSTAGSARAPRRRGAPS